MKKIFYIIMFLLPAPFVSVAQTVPAKVLDIVIKTYADKGCKLEKTFYPNFNRAHPNNMMFFTPCYPGKKIVVVTVVAKKPSDWFFKVSYGNQVPPKTNTIGDFQIDGKTYWTDYILNAFAPGFSDNSENCQTIYAYDKNEIDLPVYTMLFVYTQ